MGPVEVEEKAGQVTVRATAQSPAQSPVDTGLMSGEQYCASPSGAIGVGVRLRYVRLSSPLGGRTIVDATTGRALREVWPG